MMLSAELGLDPWDVLHQGIAQQAGIPFGTVVGYGEPCVTIPEEKCWNEVPFTVISEPSTAVPSLSPAGVALLGGLILAFSVAGIAARSAGRDSVRESGQ